MEDLAPILRTNDNVFDFNTRRPLHEHSVSDFSNDLSVTTSITEQNQYKYISKFFDFLEADEDASGINSNSQLLFFDQISKFNAQVPIPEYAIEDDGTLSMIWYGKKGSFILAFNGNLKQKEYSMICKNNDSGYGVLSSLNDILFYLSKIK